MLFLSDIADSLLLNMFIESTYLQQALFETLINVTDLLDSFENGASPPPD